MDESDRLREYQDPVESAGAQRLATVRRRRRRTVLAGVVGVLALAFLLFGLPRMVSASDEPEFCAGCHVMGTEYETWSHSGAHRRELCVDCHLPNQNLFAHYSRKAADGLKDAFYFYAGRVPEHIGITEGGEDVLQANCIRCHETAVSMIDHDRHCWECHRRIAHIRAGGIETRPPRS